MLHGFINRYVSTSVHCAILACFSLSVITPIYSFVPVTAQYDAFTGDSDIKAIFRIKKSIKKMEKDQKKGSAAVIKRFMSLKSDLERSFNVKFDVNLHMNTVRNKLKEANLSTQHLDSIQRSINKKSRKRSRKIAEMSDAYYTEDFSLMFPLEAKHKRKHKHKPKNEETEIVEEIPASVSYGVTVMLCGCFLYAIPCTRPLGKTLIGVGLTTISSGVCTEVDAKNKEKEKDKKKKR